MPRTPSAAQTEARFAETLAKVERMLSVAPYVGVNLDEMEVVRRRLVSELAVPERGGVPAPHIEEDLSFLARNFKVLARAVERMGSA